MEELPPLDDLGALVDRGGVAELPLAHPEGPSAVDCADAATQSSEVTEDTETLDGEVVTASEDPVDETMFPKDS